MSLPERLWNGSRPPIIEGTCADSLTGKTSHLRFRMRLQNLSVFTMVIVSLALSSCNPLHRDPPRAHQGVLDLRGWDLHHDGNVPIDGEWEFYWRQLIEPSTFLNDTLQKPNPTALLNIPGIWNGRFFNGEKTTGIGYGTYHVRLLRDPGPNSLALRLLDEATAYRLWINGHLIATNGVVSAFADSAESQLIPQIVTFIDTNQVLDCVVQVSNYSYHKGGMWESISLGTSSLIISSRERSAAITIFIVGVLFILAVYHFWIFIFRKSDLLAIWFGAGCISLALRAIVTSDRLIYMLFPGFNYQMLVRIEYLSVVTLPTIFISYMSHFFPGSIPRHVVKVFHIIAIVNSVIVILVPLYYVTSLIIILQAASYVAMLCMVYFTGILIRRKVRFAFPYLLSTLIMVVFFTNDLLYSNQIVNTAYVGPLGMSFYLMLQAYFLAARISETFNSMERLSNALNVSNQNLEKRVALRTHELEERSTDLEAEKQKANALLFNILPEETARELQQFGKAQAKTYGMVTVLFTDFKDFSTVSERISPELLVAEIDACFSAFDSIMEKYKIEKIKTVGDAYIAVAGLPVPTFSHANDAVAAAQEILEFMKKRMVEKVARKEVTFEIRVGIHTGPVVAGIVGTKKFAFDIWGDAVNVAARMEQNSEAGRINISGATYQLVHETTACQYRGKIEAKNKGFVDMYYVLGDT